jgi:hypothetical protein
MFPILPGERVFPEGSVIVMVTFISFRNCGLLQPILAMTPEYKFGVLAPYTTIPA